MLCCVGCDVLLRVCAAILERMFLVVLTHHVYVAIRWRTAKIYWTRANQQKVTEAAQAYVLI